MLICQPVKAQVLSIQCICYPEIIEIGIAAYFFCGVVKQRKPVAHKVWQGVSHFQLCANGRPLFAIKTVKEISHIFFIGKIALCFKKHGVL